MWIDTKLCDLKPRTTLYRIADAPVLAIEVVHLNPDKPAEKRPNPVEQAA